MFNIYLTLFVLLALSWSLVAIRARHRKNTSNAAPVLSAGFIANATAMQAVPDNGWFLIAPYGDHSSPDLSYTQVFGREQADEIVRSWNSLTGRAARLFKNLRHGLGAKWTMPVFEGHPDSDPRRWNTANVLAEVSEVKADDTGLWGRVTWNASGMASRERGQLFPSPLWWHEPPDASAQVFPALIESIGLVPTPNIAAAVAWTRNAAQQTTDPDPMNEQQLQALRKALGLAPAATVDEVLAGAAQATANASKAAEHLTALTTANTATTEAQTQLATVRAEVVTLQADKDKLTTTNAAIIDATVAFLEKNGVITPANREEVKGKFTANFAATLAELEGKESGMNTQALNLGATQQVLATENSRRDAFNEAVRRKMNESHLSYDDAFASCMRDPSLASLVAAMKDPTRK